MPWPTIAAKVPDGAQPESRVKRWARWLGHDHITAERYFVPYAEVVLAPLALQTLVLVIDGSVGGRGGVALRIHVVSKGRALPLAWVVRRGKKGHCPEALPIALIEQVHTLIPPGGQVVGLGDGACDGTGLQHPFQEAGWSSVCRTGSTMTASWDGMTFRLETVRWCIKPGPLVELPAAAVTREAYGPILLRCCWATGYQEPLDVVSNLDAAEEACRLDAKRLRIATVFSEQKNRGFHLHTSPIADQQRLSRLLVAACFASMWVISLGAVCEKDGWVTMIHRGDRCDGSVFQMGLRLLDHLLHEDFLIPVTFHIVIEMAKSVR